MVNDWLNLTGLGNAKFLGVDSIDTLLLPLVVELDIL